MKRFGDKTVVDHVTMTVAEGEIVGFLGPNGSGKTTTIRIMCGLLTPDEGEGEVLGYDLRTESLKIKREVGYMTQKFSFYEDLTIAENLEFVARLYELKPVSEHVDRTLRRPRPDLAARSARRHAVRRLEAAAGARRLHHAQAETTAARRTDSRRRPQGAARVLGRDPPPRARRAHRARLDPLHGRGRALPPHQLHLLRQDAGLGQRRRGGEECRADDLRRRRAAARPGRFRARRDVQASNRSRPSARRCTSSAPTRRFSKRRWRTSANARASPSGPARPVSKTSSSSSWPLSKDNMA